MKSSICFLLLLLSFYKGQSQVITDSILVENYYRTFHFKKPNQSAANFNLVFVLHGSGGNGKGMMQPALNLEKLAGKEPVFLVYPDGYQKYWNECRKNAKSLANTENINEQAFFELMIQYFKKQYQVKDQYFFAIGLSGGGHMAYKLALTMPDKCKAISAVVANLPDNTNLDCAEAKMPVAVMIINGTQDSVNPYTGGEMMVNGSSYGKVLSTDHTFNYWASLAGYTGKPQVETLPDPVKSNTQTITRYSFKAKGKPEIALLKVMGGSHSFPEDVDAFTESWRFFQRQLAR